MIKNIELNEADRKELTEFMDKWHRCIEKYAYEYSNPPRIESDDLISMFEEGICILFAQGKRIDVYGVAAYIKKSMYRNAIIIYNRYGYEIPAQFTDANEDNKVQSPSYEYDYCNESDVNSQLSSVLKNMNLSKRDVDMLMLRFGYDYTFNEIANKYGVSHQYVQQKIAKILKKKNVNTLRF